METYITFQYKPEGRRPDDITLSDVPTLLPKGSMLPNIDDIVTIELASVAREFQNEQVGNLKQFQVGGRHFVYVAEDKIGSKGEKVKTFTHCNIVVVVTDVDDDIIGSDIKE